MQPQGQLQVLRIKGVVGKKLRPGVGITAGEGGRQTGRRETIGFKAGRLFIRRAGIEMQADEQISVTSRGERDAIGIGHVRVTGARQIDPPAFRFEQRHQSQGPVEGELLFKPSIHDAVRANVRPAVPGINHNGPVAKRQRRPEQQRFNIFLQINTIDKDLVVDELRGKTQIHFHAVPRRFTAADVQNHFTVR